METSLSTIIVNQLSCMRLEHIHLKNIVPDFKYIFNLFCLITFGSLCTWLSKTILILDFEYIYLIGSVRTDW